MVEARGRGEVTIIGDGWVMVVVSHLRIRSRIYYYFAVSIH